ncbi:hypothetical protein M413DRAFT_31419 [Hebeloma cylindrosporum]|uniref:Uncharacterized protein n=1 Tax=Hebeloma cylindrosporum TaxID=76867 RepID=A0A0C2Y6Y3_HEBCY|nr:hypothetical protein M413DRAFT_31419 [Hebeloma cylindrosporum h7]
MAQQDAATATDLDAFSEPIPSTHWHQLASKFGVDDTRDIYQLHDFSVPRLSLPPSFHRAVMRSSSQWLDVHQQRHSVRLMDVWHVPVSAYRRNITKKFSTQSPVYAVLTDMEHFYFIRYDGCNFTLYEDNAHISRHSHPLFLDGMRNVRAIATDVLFSIILQGYISTLDAIHAEVRPYTRGTRVDRSEHSTSLREAQMKSHATLTPSLQSALTVAKLAQTALRQANHTSKSLETWEAAGAYGLALLQSSATCLTKIGSHTDWNQEKLELELDKILCGQLEEE